MNIYAKLALILIILASYAGTYYKGRVDEKSVQIEQQRDGLIAYAEKIKQGVEQNDKDRAVISKLHTDVERLRSTVHIPTCTQGTNEAGRVLSASVDRLFGVFQERIGGLIQECDQLNIDAIRMNKLISPLVISNPKTD